MKILRLKIYQPHAHYRIPFTFSRRHTYPVPPYSTVIGFICNILGIRNQEDEKFEKLKNELSLAIYGKFESMTREYIWFRDLAEESHKSRFGSAINRVIDQTPEHPGGQMPTRIDVLEEVKLIIYIHHEKEEFLEEIKENLLNPEKRIYPLHLGRAEDWIVFDGKPEESIKVLKDIIKNKIYGKFDYYTWIPDYKSRNGEEEFEFVKLNLEGQKIKEDNYKNFFDKIQGSSHLITSFYCNKNGFRVFEYIPVKLFEGGSFLLYFGKAFEFFKDKELNIPLFFAKMKYPEEENV